MIFIICEINHINITIKNRFQIIENQYVNINICI